MTTADKIAANTTILVMSRIAMLLTPALLSAMAFLFWLYLDGISADASAAVSTANKLETRVTVLEGNEAIGRQDRIRYQDQVLAQLMKLTDKVDNQAGQIAALTATIEALKGKR
ncbi:hypothetical protein [Kaistia adipata]|uniref:hypothetical protein n=1 Tax=Kaistia adipata TaxID=166954 RepID=UPI000409859B|nr:hypothetical protein [Kaistia adipata]